MLVLLILKSYMTSLYSNTIIPLQGLGYLGSCRISSSHRSLGGGLPHATEGLNHPENQYPLSLVYMLHDIRFPKTI